MLKADGYEVRQIHSDRAAEFISPKLERWCRERDILQTWSAGAEPQSNGRAERTVQEIKSRVRRLLHAARVGPEWWPVALRNVNERLRRERMKVNWNGQKFEEIPAFMQEVTVKKRVLAHEGAGTGARGGEISVSYVAAPWPLGP